MKYLKRFDKAVLEGLILEKAVVVSDKLLKVLKTMESPIAKDLIMAHEDGSDVVDNSYVDYDQEDGMVSYLPANREINRNTGEEIADKWDTRGRQKISIGRYVRAMLTKANLHYPDAEIEKFTNEYKAKQKPTRFVTVKDIESIKKYYLESNYDELSRNGDSSLFASCMRHSEAQTFFTFYANPNTPAKLLVLLNNENDKVMGRAILWDDVIDMNDNTSFTYMDRIYTADVALEETFKAYGRDIGCWYKVRQGNISASITDGNTTKLVPLKVAVDINALRNRMPYMDTFGHVGFEFVGNNTIVFLYNDTFIVDNHISNYYATLRSQHGAINHNGRCNTKKDIRGRRKNTNYVVLKDYEDYKWVQDEEDDSLLNPNNFETVYSLLEKGGDNHDEVVLSLGLDYSRNGEDNGLCVVETAIFNNKYGDYKAFSNEIVDIICEKNLLVDYKDWDDESNFKIPEQVPNAVALDKLLNNVHSIILDEPTLLLSRAANKECAEVILKHCPEIMQNELTASVLIQLLKYKLIPEKLIPEKIQECNFIDGIYEDGELWVKINDYKNLLFIYSDSDDSREHTSSREFAESILDWDWEYGYAEYTLNDVDFSMIDDRRLEQILTIMESDISYVKDWYVEKGITWTENWKDKFREDKSRKVLWRCIKTNFDNICNAIVSAYDSSKENADMDEAYNKTIEALNSVLTIKSDTEGIRFKFDYMWGITATNTKPVSLYKFVENYYDDWEEYSSDNITEPKYAEINFPYYGWSGVVHEGYFNDELDNNLSQIG